MSRVHKFVAIGVGPFNLGLACLADPLEVDGVFLDRAAEFSWHPGMLLEGAELQVPFLADLVTMADPASPYSFLSYLKDVGRLYPFYVRESFYPLRREFDAYCRWAAERVRGVRYCQEAVATSYDERAHVYRVTCRDPRDGTVSEYAARHLVVGIGSRPHVPAPLAGLDGRVWHSSDYLRVRDQVVDAGDVTVVGSGQSAAEIVHDLLSDPRAGALRLRWVTRSPRFFPLEYTKLTLELTSPEYSRHFQSLPEPRRAELLREQAGLYKGISGHLVDEIHELLYRRSLTPAPAPELLISTEVVGASYDGARQRLDLRHGDTGEDFSVESSAVVAATGYRQETPAFLDGVRDRLRLDDHGRLLAREDFSVDRDGGEVFVQNAELHTHGIVAPDLGMGAWRNSVILERMLGRAPYPVERRVAFQEFGVPATAELVR
jgi:lysine N6-hydroxylase